MGKLEATALVGLALALGCASWKVGYVQSTLEGNADTESKTVCVGQAVAIVQSVTNRGSRRVDACFSSLASWGTKDIVGISTRDFIACEDPFSIRPGESASSRREVTFRNTLSPGVYDLWVEISVVSQFCGVTSCPNAALFKVEAGRFTVSATCGHAV